MVIVISGSGKIEIGTCHLDVNGKSIMEELKKALEIKPDDYSEIVGRIKIVVEPYQFQELKSFCVEGAPDV